jgi:murein DD-endopeptidase MepM/ murein hydrolase activator NlpD
VAKHKRPLDINTTYNGHSGIDYPYPMWHPIPATGEGYISARGSNDRGGYFAYVIYDDGQVEGSFHMPDHSGPGEGTRVSEGTVVGYVGSTGNSTGPHLHHEVEYPQGNRREPPDYWNCMLQGAGEYVSGSGGGGGGPVAGNQRVVGPNPANGRSDPSTVQAPTQTLDPGTVANMDGWVYGENVQGQNVWFRGAYSGDWFWSGGFTDQGTHDLSDLNESVPAVGPTQRQVGVNPANGRSEPTTAVPVAQTLDGGTIADFDGWTYGEDVDQNDVWFHGAFSGNWFWSGGFTDTGTHDLPEIDPEPAPPAYSFEAFDPVVTEVVPCAPTNYESGQGGTRFPTDQTDVVLHDYGTYNQDTYEGTVSWFQNGDAFTSAHFVVSWEHRTQMVSLEDRAFHAGADGNWHIGIEIDPVVGQPVGTPGRQETIDSVNLLLDALRAYYTVDTFVYHRHSEFMQTSCGDDIHFEDYPQGIVIDPPPPGEGPLDPALFPVLWSVKGELDRAFTEETGRR